MQKLESVLSDVIDEGSLLTIQPGGNHGDNLIYIGFDKFIDDINISRIRFGEGQSRYDRPPKLPSVNVYTYKQYVLNQATYMKHRLFNDISAVYIHGGGNFNDLWEGGIDCYKVAARYFDCPIIIGPQSCQFNSTDPTTIFENVDNETHFFCREKYSYDIIKKATENCDNTSVYLEDDTALYLSADDLPVNEFSEDYTLLAMRMDKESADPLIEDDIPGPVKARDISKMEESYIDWVNVAAKAKRIYTDRLHVAILGIILDKPITWYDIGYHKSKGVYEYSISGQSSVEFK